LYFSLSAPGPSYVHVISSQNFSRFVGKFTPPSCYQCLKAPPPNTGYCPPWIVRWNRSSCGSLYGRLSFYSTVIPQTCGVIWWHPSCLLKSEWSPSSFRAAGLPFSHRVGEAGGFSGRRTPFFFEEDGFGHSPLAGESLPSELFSCSLSKLGCHPPLQRPFPC